MRNILIKDVMMPISDYASIKDDQTLFDVFQILDPVRASAKQIHRDLIVVDKKKLDKLEEGKMDHF